MGMKGTAQGIVNGTVETDGSYTCGDEHGVRYRVVESLCCTPATNVTWCIDYTSIKNF